MNKFLTTNIGRLRLIGFIEGISFIVLVFIAMPLKYIWGNSYMVKIVGQLHGILFLLFIVATVIVAFEQKWKLMGNTAKVLISSLIPFGTFYIDKTFLRKV
jgi:integral membrane protein